MNNLLVKTYTAGGTIPPCRIVKPGSADGQVVLAAGAGAGEFLMGISVEYVTATAGGRVDVVKAGIANLEFGGSVARGQPITSDASGRGIGAVPAAGVNVRIIGFAEVSAASGDIAPVLIAPGIMQG